MEQRIKVETAENDYLDYNEEFIEEEPLDIKVEKEDCNNSSAENETNLENFCWNLDYLKISTIKVEATDDSQNLEKSSELDAFQSNVTSENNFDSSDEEILPSDTVKKRKSRNLHNKKRKKTKQQDKELFSCTKCEYTATKYAYLKSHEGVHSDKRPYQCSKCDYSSKFHSGLSYHNRKYHKGKRYCAIQGKSSRKRKKHLTSGKESSNSSVLHNVECHESENHSKELIYKCIHCGDSFSDLKFLRAHEENSKCIGIGEYKANSSLSENLEKPYKEEIKYIETPVSDLKTLNTVEECVLDNTSKPLINVDEKQFQCTMCKFSTNQHAALVDHEFFHTGKRPYACLKCNFRFKYRSNLYSHRKWCNTNNEIKKFQCKMCNYSTNLRFDFRDHEFFHTGKRPYKCLKCNFSYKYRTNLSMHEKRCTGTKKSVKLRNKNKAVRGNYSDEKGGVKFRINSSHNDITNHDHNLRKSSQQKFFYDISDSDENFEENLISSKMVCDEIPEANDISSPCSSTDPQENGISTQEGFNNLSNKRFPEEISGICAAKVHSNINCSKDTQSPKSASIDSNGSLTSKSKFMYPASEKPNFQGKTTCNEKEKPRKEVNVNHTNNLNQNENEEVIFFSGENSVSQDVNSDKDVEEDHERDEIEILKPLTDEDKSKSEKESNNTSVNLSLFTKESEGTSKEINTNRSGDLNKNLLKCSVCMYATQISTQMRFHQDLHAGRFPYRCLKCNFGASYASMFIRHKLSKKCKKNKPELERREIVTIEDNFSDEAKSRVNARTSDEVSSQCRYVLRNERNNLKKIEMAGDLYKDLDFEETNKSSDNHFSSNIKNKNLFNNNDVDLDDPKLSTSEDEHDNDLSSKRKSKQIKCKMLQKERNNDSQNKSSDNCHKNLSNKSDVDLDDSKLSTSENECDQDLGLKRKSKQTKKRKTLQKERNIDSQNLKSDESSDYCLSYYMKNKILSNNNDADLHDSKLSTSEDECNIDLSSKRKSKRIKRHKMLEKGRLTDSKNSKTNDESSDNCSSSNMKNKNLSYNIDVDLDDYSSSTSEDEYDNDLSSKKKRGKPIKRRKMLQKKRNRESQSSETNDESSDNIKNNSLSNNIDADLDDFKLSTSEDECDKDLGSKRKSKRIKKLKKLQKEKNIDSQNSDCSPDEDELHSRSKRRFSKRISKRSGNVSKDNIKDNFSESLNSDDNSIFCEDSSVSVGTSYQNNKTESNEGNIDRELSNDSNISELNLDAIQSENEMDIDEQLFKYFPADSEDIYGDDALIQIFFQKPKVLVEKLKLQFCTTCDFVFESSSKLEAHKYETHMKSKKYECPDYDYTSVTCQSLKTHTEIHLKDVCEEIVSFENEPIGIERIEENNVNNTNGKSEDELQENSSFSEAASFSNDDEDDVVEEVEEQEEESCNVQLTSENTQMLTNIIENISCKNFSGFESDYQLDKNNDESNIVRNVDWSHFYEHLFEVINNKVLSRMKNFLGIIGNQNLLKENMPECSQNPLIRDQKVMETILEKVTKDFLSKQSQNNIKVVKPVDKTSYRYINKAIDLYKISLGDEADITSSDAKMESEESADQDCLNSSERNENVCKDILEKVLKYKNCMKSPQRNENVSKDVLNNVLKYLNCIGFNDVKGKSFQKDDDGATSQKFEEMSINNNLEDHISLCSNSVESGEERDIELCSNYEAPNKSEIDTRSSYGNVENMESQFDPVVSLKAKNNMKKLHRKSFFCYDFSSQKRKNKNNVTEKECGENIVPIISDKESNSHDEIMMIDEIKSISSRPLGSVSASMNDCCKNLYEIGDNFCEFISSTGNGQSPSIKNPGNISKEHPFTSLNSKFGASSMVESVTEVDKPSCFYTPLHQNYTYAKNEANLSAVNCENTLTSISCSNFQELPRNPPNISSLSNANEYVALNSNSNERIILVPSNFNINVEVSSAPIIYSNNELTVSRFQAMSGVIDNPRKLHRTIPEPSISIISGYTPGCSNKVSGSQKKVKIETDFSPVDHVMTNLQDSVQPLAPKLKIPNLEYSSHENVLGSQQKPKCEMKPTKFEKF